MNIYLDKGSIENEILRRHPEILKCATFIDTTTAQRFAVVNDVTACKEGHAIRLDHYEDEDYYGFSVQIARWKPKEQE